MRRATNKPSHGERNRFLNIVYFVESARSHTIRINLTYARWAIALALIVVAWSIGSLFWIAHLQYQSAKTHDRLQHALTTIFDYQIKNEKIFDEAYPPESTNGYYSELAQLPSNNPIAETTALQQLKSETKTQDKNIQTQPLAKTAPLPKPPTQVAEAPKKPATPGIETNGTTAAVLSPVSKPAELSIVPRTQNLDSSEPSLEISAAKLSKTDGHIDLNFTMKNKNPERAEGFIWAVAVIAQENGEAKRVVAPIHTRIDSKSGAILAPKSGYRFSILKFKNKEFEFKAPGRTTWKLTKLTIHYTNVEGRNEQKIEIPVEQVAITNVADTPATDIAL
jgi:hypothetical protein